MVRAVTALLLLMVALLGGGPGIARAESFDFSAMTLSLRGLVDGRVAATSERASFLAGGFGLERYGGDGANRARVIARLADASLIATLVATSALTFQVHARAGGGQRTPIDVIEAFARYRPVSTGAWRFEARAGAFFPRLSLENTAIGWTSPYTLTPSAINSWIGEEIRAIGAEATLTWRDAGDALSTTLGVFGANDPTGAILARRGWGFNDHWTGLFDRLRSPDTLAGAAPSARAFVRLFKEIDDRPGLYGAVAWDRGEDGSVQFLAYDNLADPAAVRDGAIAWNTRFLALGGRVELPGAVTAIAQAMTGATRIFPGRALLIDDRFDAAFLLLSRDFGGHRLSLRGDWFQIRDRTPIGGLGADQDGHALTAAYVTWPATRLRLTVELLYVDADQPLRRRAGLNPKARETQSQTSLRFYF